MPQPTDNGLTYTFKVHKDVKFHDGSPLAGSDVAMSWNKIIHPPPGIASARQNNFVMVDTVTTPGDETVVFNLKFATLTFLPPLADPFAYIYSKKKLDQNMHWYEKNIVGSGPFELVELQVGQSLKGERNPDYCHPGSPTSTDSWRSLHLSGPCAWTLFCPTAPLGLRGSLHGAR
jgi:peptide/nickel transport system substrate-binding protein